MRSREVELTPASVKIIQETLTEAIAQWQAFSTLLHTTDAEKKLYSMKSEAAAYALMELYEGRLPALEVPCLSCFRFVMDTEACPNAKDICLDCCGEDH